MNSLKESKAKSDKVYSKTPKGIIVHKKARAKWKENNSEKNIESKRKWSRNNKEQKREYYQKTKDIQIQQTLERRRLNPQIKLRHNVSSLITQRLKGRLSGKNVQSIIEYLPWTIDELIKHLESKFKKGMSWKNYGFRGWHIDHKIPDSKFNYEDEYDGEFLQCWALENLQPLWWQENLRKGNRV